MSLIILTFTSKPLENNSYLIYDLESKTAAVIDPSFEISDILQVLKQNDLTLKYILNTHAHFDHIAGVSRIFSSVGGQADIALHPDDLLLWQDGGGARFFGFTVEVEHGPTLFLKHGESIHIGECTIEVRHTPGHSPGHVIFHIPEAKTCFCGDVIFRGSIGRTDLPGGDLKTLMDSIRTQVMTLPDETTLMSGHGPATKVAVEASSNPFLTNI